MMKKIQNSKSSGFEVAVLFCLCLQYAIESQIRGHNLDPATCMICMEPREVSKTPDNHFQIRDFQYVQLGFGCEEIFVYRLIKKKF